MSAANTPTGAVETIYLGAGCFWCTEAVFQQVEGVISVMPGYQGGTVPNPTYKQVCIGTTGHAEVARVVYDPARLALAKLLDVFWHAHDPTSLNRQGADTGTQYRSAIFCTTPAQREAAERSKRALEASGVYDRPIVTEIRDAPPFYAAEDYHRDYYRRNSGEPYCQMIIRPKLKKLGLKP